MKNILIGILSLTPLVAYSRPLVKQIDPFAYKIPKSMSLATYPKFEGIVRFSNCSGSLVTFKGMPKTNKALVMTNGHCVPGTSASVTLANQVQNKQVAVFDDQMKLYRLTLDLLVYATQTETDVGFYRTTMSYEQIEKEYGVEALTLNDDIVSIGTQIEVISGYWAQTTSCEAESIVPQLKEADWTWKNSLRYSKECMTRGGYSGSPVVEQNTRTVVAIHNTGNNGKLDCSDMNPCEKDENDILIFRELNRRYAQQVFQFYGCLDEKFDFNLELATCDIPRPSK